MAEIKLSKTKEGAQLSGNLPEELLAAEAIELFPLRDGIYLLCAKGAIDASKKTAGNDFGAKPEISEKEKQVIRKLMSVRFEKRTPAEVSKMLSEEEKKVLDNLIKRKMVWVFHGAKYQKEGVYNISDSAFSLAREASRAEIAPSLPANSPEHLEKSGWMVLESESEAKSFASAFPEKLKNGEVLGIRAFDKKYYFIKREYYEHWEKPALLCLGSGEKSAEEVASQIGILPGGALCLLLHMCERGEALEKHRGKFCRA
ncbi:MAG: hypothetical protein N3F07_03815 [Candidatus Micrarchaeota archaeon]|nr:hypothetical protein [Candidatus Micrarchaeota archaeon]